MPPLSVEEEGRTPDCELPALPALSRPGKGKKKRRRKRAQRGDGQRLRPDSEEPEADDAIFSWLLTQVFCRSLVGSSSRQIELPPTCRPVVIWQFSCPSRKERANSRRPGPDPCARLLGCDGCFEDTDTRREGWREGKGPEKTMPAAASSKAKCSKGGSYIHQR